METLALGLEVRERSVASSRNDGGNKTPKKGQHTSATFMTGNKSSCVYCSYHGHTSEQCHLIREVEARWQILKGSGRCFLCLKKGHMSRKCQSSDKCNHCKGTHHVTLCHKKATGTKESATEEKLKSHTCTKLALNPQAPPFENTHTYATLSSNREVLLQTAQAVIFNPLNSSRQIVAQFILDNGSHRFYITEKACKILGLKSEDKKEIIIMTFSSSEANVIVLVLGLDLKMKTAAKLCAYCPFDY